MALFAAALSAPHILSVHLKPARFDQAVKELLEKGRTSPSHVHLKPARFDQAVKELLDKGRTSPCHVPLQPAEARRAPASESLPQRVRLLRQRGARAPRVCRPSPVDIPSG